MNLNDKEAFLAMYIFLEAYYDRTKSDDIGNLMGDLALLSNGYPLDKAVWEDWQNAIKKAVNK